MRPDVGAAATLMLLLTLVALALVALVLRRSGDSSSDVAATLAAGGWATRGAVGRAPQ